MNAAYTSLRRKARGRRGSSRAASPGVGDARPLPRRGEGRPQGHGQIRQKPWAGGLSAPVRRPRETRKGGASRFPGSLTPESKGRGPLTRSAAGPQSLGSGCGPLGGPLAGIKSGRKANLAAAWQIAVEKPDPLFCCERNRLRIRIHRCRNAKWNNTSWRSVPDVDVIDNGQRRVIHNA